ncbi:MAG: thioredoxin family protein [Kofleriaceae bacterium]
MRWLAAIALVACGSSSSEPPVPPPPVTYEWARDEAHAFTRARDEHKGVLIHFFESWSIPSVEMQEMLRETRIAAVIAARFVPLQIDVSDGSDEGAAVKARYGAVTSPAIVMVDTNGKVLGRITQASNVDEVRAGLEQAAHRLPRP